MSHTSILITSRPIPRIYLEQYLIQNNFSININSQYDALIHQEDGTTYEIGSLVLPSRCASAGYMEEGKRNFLNRLSKMNELWTTT